MRRFSVPADFRTGTIDRYCELNERYEQAAVEETYGQATSGVLSNSGRSARLVPTVGLKALEDYVAYSAGRGIEFNYTFNASCMGNTEFTASGMKQINRYLGRLWGIGIRNLTISLPQLMSIVRDSGYGFTVKASTICQINCASKAAFYKRMGLNRMVIDEDITRDFGRIRQISEVFGDGVEMIVNSICLKDCPYKMFHYNHEAHFAFAKQDIRSFYSHVCTAQRAADWTSPLRLNWVRPEDLGYYESVGVHRFKIQGRQSAIHGDPVAATEAYMRGSYSGNFYSLLHLFDPRKEKDNYWPYVDNAKLEGFLAPFYENPGHCSGDCEACGYCDAFAEASMGKRNMEPILSCTLANCDEQEPFKCYREMPAAKKLASRIARKAVSAVKRQP